MRGAAVWLLVSASLLLALTGCGPAGRPAPAGPFTLLRLRKTLPAGARIRPGDVEPVRSRLVDLPGLAGYPRRVEELRGSAVVSRRERGTLLHDGHLRLGALAPEPASVHLGEDEMGLVTILAPGVAAVPGTRLELSLPHPAPSPRTRARRTRDLRAPGNARPVGVRVAVASQPTRDGTGVVLAGPPEEIRRLVAAEPPLPLTGDVVGATPIRVGESMAEASVVLGGEELATVLMATRAFREGELLDPLGLARHPVEKHLVPDLALSDPGEAAGVRYASPLHPGEILRRSGLRGTPQLAEPVELQFQGLDPDWLHPGSDAWILRWGSRDPPLPIRVTDVLRNAPGSPSRLVVRPQVGFDWPSSRPRRAGEGGSRGWNLLLTR